METTDLSAAGMPYYKPSIDQLEEMEHSLNELRSFKPIRHLLARSCNGAICCDTTCPLMVYDHKAGRNQCVYNIVFDTIDSAMARVMDEINKRENTITECVTTFADESIEINDVRYVRTE